MGDEEWLASNFEHVRLEITEVNGHYKILSDPRVVKTVTDFVVEEVCLSSNCDHSGPNDCYSHASTSQL
jgi:hypothetical protein